MQPYAIRQGDSLAKGAQRHAFDAHSVGKDPANAGGSPPSSSPPSSAPPPDSDHAPDPLDNAGLADDRRLDASTAQALVPTHGS